MIKKLFVLTLCLCLLFCSCGKLPMQSTAPETLPAETKPHKPVGIKIGFPMECTITNADGQKLSISGRDVQGDMELLELVLPPERTEVVYDSCPTYTITVPYSNSFTFEVTEIGYRGIISTSNCDISVEGTNISTAILESSDKATITGENMSLRLDSGTGDWLCTVEAQNQDAVIAKKTDTGMLLEDLEGEIILRSPSAKERISYTCIGEPIKIDVVSSPREILITPIKD